MLSEVIAESDAGIELVTAFTDIAKLESEGPELSPLQSSGLGVDMTRNVLLSEKR